MPNKIPQRVSTARLTQIAGIVAVAAVLGGGAALAWKEAKGGDTLENRSPSAIAALSRFDARALEHAARMLKDSGGIGAVISPANAIKLGLKVDQDALPFAVIYESVGITCALCRSTVDSSFADGFGRRLNGWANHALDVGRVIAAAPNLTPFASPIISLPKREGSSCGSHPLSS